jgi:hypothetical protein
MPGSRLHIEMRRISARDWYWMLRDFFIENTIDTGHAKTRALAQSNANASKAWHVKQEQKRMDTIKQKGKTT